MIVSLGEALIDFTPLIEDGRLTGFALHPAGSLCNVAIGLARLGYSSGYAGRLSEDFFGTLLTDHLHESGVDTSLVRSGNEPTPLAFVGFEHGEPVYSFRIAGTTATQIEPEDLPPVTFAEVEALHFGSLSLIYEPTASSILNLVRRLKGRVPLSFDPNLRPTLVTDWGHYREVLGECRALADLIKVSNRDLDDWQAGDPREWLTEDGPVAVIVTRGGAGSRLYHRTGIIDCPASPCQIVDTVGAGDAYSAGLLVALAERRALSRVGMAELEPRAWLEVMRFASTASALTCERVGADPPWRRDVEVRA